MNEAKFETYKVTIGSDFHLFEAASTEDLQDFLIKNFPGQHAWIENQSRNMRPFMHIATKLGPPISPHPNPDTLMR